jgi:ankyrin repeat protein
MDVPVAIPTSCNQDEALLATRSKRYALHDAVERDDEKTVEALLSEDLDPDYDPTRPSDVPIIDINERDNSGCTPLHTAVIYRATKCFKALIAHGAKTSPKCNGSPLMHLLISMYALDANRSFILEAVALLLTAKLDILALDDMGRSLLHVAAVVGATDVAEMVLNATQHVEVPLDLNFTDKLQRTPLHFAAMNSQRGMIDMLLNRGADANLPDALYGDLPAHTAAKKGWKEGFDVLLAALTDKTVQNYAGYSAVEAFIPATEANTLILTHAACADHHTCAAITRQSTYVPPENTARLETLFHPVFGSLRTVDVERQCETIYGAPPASVCAPYISRYSVLVN